MAEHNARILPFIALIALGSLGCQGQPDSSDDEPTLLALGETRSALTDVQALPEQISYRLPLAEGSLELLLERTAAPISAGYGIFTLNTKGVLVEQASALPQCSYRGRALSTDANGQETSGFVSVSLCSTTTGYPLGQALTGVLMRNGQLWDLSPVQGDTNPDNGIDHTLTPSRRGGTLTPNAAGQAITPPTVGALEQLPLSFPQVLEFREGTPQETKYIEVVLVNDEARFAQQGAQTAASGLALIEAANALLQESNINPRVRMVLTSQLIFTPEIEEGSSFDGDPYDLFSNNKDVNNKPIPLSAGEEVDHALQLDSFLGWANTAELPPHDIHLLLSGQDFFQNSAGLAPVAAACLVGQNGFLVQAESAGAGSLGFSVLSTVHELGHTLGMGHDPSFGSCAQEAHIMSAIGCANCPIGGIDFSTCSQQEFTTYLQSANYTITRCADDLPPAPAIASCGDGVVSAGESCDCGNEDCSNIDPCCDGSSCELLAGAACSDYNDGCCSQCQIVQAADTVTCRAARSECDTAEVCKGVSAQCPEDTFLDAGGDCRDAANNQGVCFVGDCMSRTPQCELLGNLLAEQLSNFDENLSGPGSVCDKGCEVVTCASAPGAPNPCVTITNAEVTEGVACNGGQCVNGSCTALVDQCPSNASKTEPGVCGCDQDDVDSDGDGTLDCFDACPDDATQQAEGFCGCGGSEVDADSDGFPDCVDECPADNTKQFAGLCGCGNRETDDDGDGEPNCADECPFTPGQVVEGACGCGLSDADQDGDGVADCNDACPDDPNASSRPCPNDAPPASEESEEAGGDDIDDRVVLKIETKQGFLCNLTGAPRGSSGSSSVWLASLAALLLGRKRRLLPRRRRARLRH